MGGLSDILLQMDSCQSDIFVGHLLSGEPLSVDMDFSGETEGHIVLRQLIVFRHIGIEIAFPVELASGGDAAGGHQPGGDGFPDRLAVRSRQHPGMPHADGTDIRIGLGPVMIRTFAEHFGRRFDLNVHLQPDNSLISSHDNLLIV